MPDNLELTAEEKSFFDTRGGEATEKKPEPIVQQAEPENKQQKTGHDEVKDPPGQSESEGNEKPGTVPQKALHEERERRKAAQKEAEEARTSFAKLQSRLDTLTEIAKTATGGTQRAETPTAPAVPDINTDPVGHFRAKTEALERELADTRKWRTDQEQRSAATNNVQRIAQIAQAKEAEYIKSTAPDYNDASTHLRNIRDAQLIAYGITDPMERGNIIAQDAITIAANALSQNKNPADIIYNMAKASGYVAKAKDEPKPADVGPSEIEKVKMAAAGQKAGASLQHINGSAPPVKGVSVSMLNQMSDEEFHEATKTPAAWQKFVESFQR